MLSYRGGVLLALAAGCIGFTIVVAMKNSTKKRKRRAPSNITWTEVGKLEKIWMYPMKSGRYVELEAADLTPIGIQEIDTGSGKYLRRDRCFIVVRDDTREMVTGRTYPALLKVVVEAIDEYQLKFMYINKEDLLINTSDLEKASKKHVTMWSNEKVDSVDCGEQAYKWITDIISSEYGSQSKFRLGYWPNSEKGRRDIITVDKNRATAFSKLTVYDSGAYSDLASYMLMTTSSIDDLQERVKSKTNTEITPLQFRPNFYVRTSSSEPFQEDNWEWIKIGDNIFRNVKPCTRCVFVNINPDTGEKNPQFEPLKTLKTYRQLKETAMRKVEGDSPVMGINLGLVQANNNVSIGDPVYVSRN